MNREAKLGLFAVLVIVVLVSVMWAKLSGEDPGQADNSALNGNTTPLEEPLMANVQLSTPQAVSESTHGYQQDPGTPGTGRSGPAPAQDYSAVLPTGYGDDPANTSSAQKRDPLDYYNTAKTKTTNTYTDDPFALDANEELTALTNDSATENTSDFFGADLWQSPGTSDQSAKSDEGLDTFTATTSFGNYDTQAEWPKVHTVAKGDTLTTISEHYYNTGRHWRLIADSNAATLPDPSMLRIGMKLRISQPPPARRARVDGVADSAVPRAGTTYKVKKGDTLSSISRTAYGTPNRWRTILAANESKLSSPERLAVGMVISLPENLQ